MFLRPQPNENKLFQIGSIASAESFGSTLFFAHLGLFLVGSLVGTVFLELWWITAMSVFYAVAFSLEKYIAAKAFERSDVSLYFIVLSLILVRAISYNVLTVFIWSTDGDIFKFAALALLVVATINIMVFHVSYVPIVTSVVGPIWIAFGAIAFLFFWEMGLTTHSVVALVVVACASPYFMLALFSAQARHKELHWTKQALNRSERQEILGKLVAGVAHDFNNVLSVTLANAEMLKDTTNISKERQDRYTVEIMKAAQRGASLTDQLLAFARGVELNPDRYDVRPLLDDLDEMIHRLFPATISVSTSMQNGTPAVFVDRNQFDLALLNVAINARDAMKNGGELKVTADSVQLSSADLENRKYTLPAGTYVRFRLSDTGEGISEDMRNLIFDPFFTTKNVGEGSGLGLSMVAGFVEQSGGKIFLESKIDHGTTMTLLLPASIG